jgi:nuclear GTP-binding protein
MVLFYFIFACDVAITRLIEQAQMHQIINVCFPRVHVTCRWFGNTRVIGQAQLQQFREDVGAKVADPYSVLLKEKKLPLALLGSGYTNKERRGQLLGVQSFGETFGKGALRKRPKLQAEDYTALLQTVRRKRCYI